MLTIWGSFTKSLNHESLYVQKSQWKIEIQLKLRLGVSICLDVISIEISISTPKKSLSRQLRFSRQFEKRHLDSRDFLDSSKTKSRQSRLL